MDLPLVTCRSFFRLDMTVQLADDPSLRCGATPERSPQPKRKKSRQVTQQPRHHLALESYNTQQQSDSFLDSFTIIESREDWVTPEIREPRAESREATLYETRHTSYESRVELPFSV
jgi:hypothetical protein